MTKMQLINFKAHSDLEINLLDRNLLLYGDNGAGKSSIYEAFKLVFFNSKLEAGVKSVTTSENEIAAINDFYRGFDRKNATTDFNIKINDYEWITFDKTNYDAYLLSIDDVFFNSKFLNLNELLKSAYFTSSVDIEANYKAIQDKTNQYLKDFLEDIEVDIDSSDDYFIKIRDQKKGILTTKEIKKYFNEAKINLVVLLLLFSSIEISKDMNKKNILILDDFITSLDMSNRTFLMKYILDTFKDFQILIFTHNIYFYNLIMYLINNNICKTTKEWQFANIFEISNEHKMYINNIRIDTSELRTEYDTESRKPNPNFAQIGNKVRQKFERLLYEFSKILMIGSVEESNKILEVIDEHEMFYLLRYEYRDSQNKKKVKYKNSNDLINEIEKITTNLDDVKSKIDEYKIYSSSEIKEILTNLKLYRKVMMHPSSHGQLIGAALPQDKELKYSIDLIDKLEKNIKDLTDKKVDGA